MKTREWTLYVDTIERIGKLLARIAAEEREGAEGGQSEYSILNQSTR